MLLSPVEGKGVITAKDGSGEMATELGRGIIRFVDGGRKAVGRRFIYIQVLQQQEK